MTLWNKSDAAGAGPTGGAPKFLPGMLGALGVTPAANTKVLFVDNTEAAQPATRAKGIKGPGWWLHRTYTAADGSVKNRAEMLAFVRNDAGTATDVGVTITGYMAAGDDAIGYDTTIVISAQPPARVVASGATTYPVTAAGSPTATTLTYQWQISTNGGTSYSNISNGGVYSTATTATLNISAVAGLFGNLYRCMISSSGAVSAASLASAPGTLSAT